MKRLHSTSTHKTQHRHSILTNNFKVALTSNFKIFMCFLYVSSIERNNDEDIRKYSIKNDISHCSIMKYMRQNSKNRRITRFDEKISIRRMTQTICSYNEHSLSNRSIKIFAAKNQRKIVVMFTNVLIVIIRRSKMN